MDHLTSDDCEAISQFVALNKLPLLGELTMEYLNYINKDGKIWAAYLYSEEQKTSLLLNLAKSERNLVFTTGNIRDNAYVCNYFGINDESEPAFLIYDSGINRYFLQKNAKNYQITEAIAKFKEGKLKFISGNPVKDFFYSFDLDMNDMTITIIVSFVMVFGLLALIIWLKCMCGRGKLKEKKEKTN